MRAIFSAVFLVCVTGCAASTADVPEVSDPGSPDAAATVPGPDAMPFAAPPDARADSPALKADGGPDSAPATVVPEAAPKALDGAPDRGKPPGDDAGIPADGGAIPFLCTVPAKSSAAVTLALVEMNFPAPCALAERSPSCATFADPRLPGQWVTKPVECRCGHWAYAWVPTAGGEQSIDVREAFACSTQCLPNTLCPL